MSIQDHVVGLETAKRLKELGVKQESYFYWLDHPVLGTYWVASSNDPDWRLHNPSAFLASELQLPYSYFLWQFKGIINLGKLIHYDYIDTNCSDIPNDEAEHLKTFHTTNLAEAHGLATIYLIEKGIIKP